jgi:predicted metalloprotease
MGGGSSPDFQPQAPLLGKPRWRARHGLTLALGALGLALTACSVESRPSLSAEPSAPHGAAARATRSQQDAELSALSRALLEDVNASWARDFKRRVKPYPPAAPVFFEDGERPDCGLPFVKPGRAQCADTHNAYIDLSFQRELRERFGSAADGTRAYAIAHEMGHHVQRVLGLDRQVEKLLADRPVSTHAVQVQLELQADCFAGVWSRSSKQDVLREPAQVDTALRQASELGTERLLAKPGSLARASESYTYAIPRRRMYWFYQGFSRGQVQDCDTFAPG